jgi:cobalamin synthase
MGFMRNHRVLIASLAGLAMLAHVLAAAFCPNMASHSSSRGYADSVLGWVTLCVTSTAGTDAPSGTTGDGQSHSEHSSLCASLCAAVVTTVAAFTAILVAVLVLVVSTKAVFFACAPRVQRRFLFGGIGSRAPPALV